MDQLLSQIRACQLCAHLPLGPRPILQASPTSQILIAGQAPGRVTHAKGRPFDDVSGERLRGWLGVTRAQFYDPALFAIVPMGFCFPGTGKNGDMPPPAICADTWREKILSQLSQIKLTLVIGQYAQAWHLPESKGSLTDAVRAHAGSKSQLVLPHPSPRNGRWLKSNAWFEAQVVPTLRERVGEIFRSQTP